MWALLEEQEGFDFDARDSEGRTALAYAAVMGRPHALVALLSVRIEHLNRGIICSHMRAAEARCGREQRGHGKVHAVILGSLCRQL